MIRESTKAKLNRAAALHEQGNGEAAITLFEEILAEDPSNSEGWYELGYLRKAQGRYEAALDAFGQALALGVSRAEEVHLNRGVIYSDHLRRDALAEDELRGALQINPRYVPALLNLGNLQEERGDRALAIESYSRAIALFEAPDNAHPELCLEALGRRANLRKPSELDDPVFAELEHAAERAARYGHLSRTNLLFILGHCYDHIGAYDKAFDAYARGNRCQMRMSGRRYDPAHWEALTTAMMETFAAPAASTLDRPTSTAAKPLFICGMFRSGSTLIEQVLGAHEQITPGGELDFLMRLAAEKLAPFPQSMRTVSPQRDLQFAQAYHQHLATLFPDGIAGTYITDKRPDNFLLIGLIKQLFPNAKIVHTTRNPMDNGLSVFLQHLVHDVAPYSSDLQDIGHYYGQYRRLMAHWQALYPDSIYSFDYDEFVRNPKDSLNGLLRFLELPWQLDLLEFHSQKNVVKTASYWQVREPLYMRASGRWQNYRDQLKPLCEALNSAGLSSIEWEKTGSVP